MNMYYYKDFILFKHTLQHLLVKQIDVVDGSSLSNKTEMLCQLILWKSYNLLIGIEKSLRSNNFDVIVLCIRSQLEILGVLCTIEMEYKKYLQNKTTFDHINEKIDNFILGSKNENYGKGYTTLHVMDFVRNIDKMKYLPTEDKTFFLHMYDVLCEFCHPNSYSLITNIKSVDNKVYIFGHYTFEKKEFEIIDYSKIVYPLLIDVYQIIHKELKEKI